MSPPYDFKQYAVLYVDDEPMALKYFEKTFGGEFRIITAENASEGLRILEEKGDDIAVILTDQRMPGEKGVQLLERARQLRPQIVRMIITAYADLGVTVDAVNLGAIFRYISKPLQVEDVRNTLRRAMEFFLVHHERDDLLKEKLSVLLNMLITDRVVSMGVLAAGLGTRLRRPLQAVEAFLDTTASLNGVDSAHAQWSMTRDAWTEAYHAVLGQSKRLAEILDSVLAQAGSAPAAAPARPTDWMGKALGSVEKLSHDKGLQINASLGGDALPEKASAVSLIALGSLLLKAECERLPYGSILNITALGTADELSITLESEAGGLPVDDLRAVFDPRFESAATGVDWGLAMLAVHFLVHDLGGTVKISPSPQSKGTKIHLTLPVQEVPADADGDFGAFVTKVLVNDRLWARLLTSPE